MDTELVFVIRANGDISVSDGAYTIDTEGLVTLSGGSTELNASSIENLIGSTGANTFVFERGAVLLGTVNGSNGVAENRLDFSAFITAINVDLDSGNATATAGISNIQHVIGGSGDDTIGGDGFQNELIGGAGNDILTGGDANDILNGGAGIDILDAGAGDDALLGGADNDTLRGGAGIDQLDGGSGSNWIDGGADEDILIAEADADITLSNDSLVVGAQTTTIAGIEQANLNWWRPCQYPECGEFYPRWRTPLRQGGQRYSDRYRPK